MKLASDIAMERIAAQDRKVRAFLTHLSKAAKLATKLELTLGNGALVDSMLTGIAADVEQSENVHDIRVPKL